MIVSLYVDDLIFTGNDESIFVKFNNSMKSEFEMTDLEKMKYFLSVMMRAYYFLRSLGWKKVTVKNPIVPGVRLTNDEKGAKINATMYRQLIGSLMYLTATRPDLMYVVSLMSRFMASPIELHLQATKRVLRYLKGTIDLGIKVFSTICIVVQHMRVAIMSRLCIVSSLSSFLSIVEYTFTNFSTTMVEQQILR